MKISSLRPDPRYPGYLLVTVDGTRFTSLPKARVAALGLRQGQALDEEGATRLREAADDEKAYRAALRMLQARPRSVYELLHRLRAKQHPARAASEAVGRLEQAGLLDDAAFARHFASVGCAKGWGRSRLLAGLLQRRVARHDAERAIDQVLQDEGVDATAQAEALARKRAFQLRHVPPAARLRRVLGYLERRGFRGGDVVRVARKAVADDAQGRSR